MHSILFLASPKVLVSFNFKKWVYLIHLYTVGRTFRRGFPNGIIVERGSIGSTSMSRDDLNKLPCKTCGYSYNFFAYINFPCCLWNLQEICSCWNVCECDLVQVATTISIWIRGCLLLHLVMVPRRMRDAFNSTLTHTMCKMEGVLG